MSVCGRLDLLGGFLAEGDLGLVREVGVGELGVEGASAWERHGQQSFVSIADGVVQVRFHRCLQYKNF